MTAPVCPKIGGGGIAGRVSPNVGAVVYSDRVSDSRTRNREFAGSTHTRSTASNLEQLANLPCAQANSASYLQQSGK